MQSFCCDRVLASHEAAVTSIALHPSNKPIGMSACADGSWHMWHLQNGDLIMSGQGHSSSSGTTSVAFHPKVHLDPAEVAAALPMLFMQLLRSMAACAC